MEKTPTTTMQIKQKNTQIADNTKNGDEKKKQC